MTPCHGVGSGNWKDRIARKMEIFTVYGEKETANLEREVCNVHGIFKNSQSRFLFTNATLMRKRLLFHRPSWLQERCKIRNCRETVVLNARKVTVANVEEASLKKADVLFRSVVIEETESRVEGVWKKKEKRKKMRKCQTRLETRIRRRVTELW